MGCARWKSQIAQGTPQSALSQYACVTGLLFYVGRAGVSLASDAIEAVRAPWAKMEAVMDS